MPDFSRLSVPGVDRNFHPSERKPEEEEAHYYHPRHIAFWCASGAVNGGEARIHDRGAFCEFVWPNGATQKVSRPSVLEAVRLGIIERDPVLLNAWRRTADADETVRNTRARMGLA